MDTQNQGRHSERSPRWTGGPRRQGVEDVRSDAGDAARSAGYDPADYTVEEVLAYVAEHPDEAADVVVLEADGKNRKGIVEHVHVDDEGDTAR
jgi:hypothetical protein